jgi:Rrf2 family transcriptional regulator, nitric oxide-sensitive transcriptional repressor
MRLTSFTDYSLRVLMYVAAQPGRHTTIAEIAAAFGISESHLTKVVHHLGKTELLTNARGRGGGVALASAPEQINLGAIVRAAEANHALVECFDTKANHCLITPVCGLRAVLEQALDAFYGVLDRYTLADITANRATLQAVLGMALTEDRAYR